MTQKPENTEPAERGFGSVLTNRPFRSLWAAQWLAQVGQNAINFIQLILIEQLTGSTVQIGITILAFTLPGVIFSPLAGIVADRFPKKWVLVISNFTRIVVALSYLIVLIALQGGWRLAAIYMLTFLMSTLSQFFAPAEAAMIPMLIGEKRLLAANSLFSLTMVLSQMAGLVILGPIMVRALGLEGGFVAVGMMYLGATVLVTLLPTDRAPAHTQQIVASPWRRLGSEFKAGVSFIATQPGIKAAMAQLITINTLVMVLAMLTPGYTARVLGLGPENAVIVFAPAGIGMLVATGVVGRWGYLLRRIGFGYIGLMLAGLAFFSMGLLSLDYHRFLRPILDVVPQAALSLTSTTMLLGIILGFCMAAANILAQTTVQQDSPAHIRGRVLSVQFMLANLVGIVPMLVFGGLADAIGIPRVLQIIGGGTILAVALSFVVAGPTGRPAWLSRRGAGRLSDP
jgi:MFS family permease